VASRSHRIVSTAPSITEILFALGAGDQVVGDTTYCNYPEAAKHKPKIGGFTTPSTELILAVHPDLVFMTEERPDIAEILRNSGRMQVVNVRPDSVAGIYQSIQTVAGKLGITDRGRTLIHSIDLEIHQGVPRTGGPAKPKVLFVVGRTPGSVTDLIVVGRGGYLTELIELAGGINIAADTATPYPRFSFEEVIRRDPDIIVDMGHDQMATEARKQAVKQLWQKYPFLRAVRLGAVYPISAEYFVTPGPRVGQAVRDLRKIFAR
jgi:iron complex transport system substrate-binding protein